MVIQSTGGGKSLCFPLPGLMIQPNSTSFVFVIVFTVQMGNIIQLHCCVKREEDLTRVHQTTIEDHSCNGTFVNGVRIGRGKKKYLANGDVVAFTGPTSNIFTYCDAMHKNVGFPKEIKEDFLMVKLLGKQ